MPGAHDATGLLCRWCRSLPGVALLLAAGILLGADDGAITTVLSLHAADATALAAAMGGTSLEDTFALMAREAGTRRDGRLMGVRGLPALSKAGGGMADMLPEGLAGPPVALPDRNALLVRGTPAAIEEFRELVEALDKPVPQVQITVDVFSSPTRFDTERALRWRAMGDGVLAAAGAGGPAGRGLEMYVGVGDVQLAYDTSIGRSATTKHESMMVATQSGSPALIGIRTQRLTPVPLAVLDAFGFVQTVYDLVETEIATGLYVLPRVNADRTVTMHLAPVLDRPVGEVAVPGGGELPVVESLTETTVVTVADGQTVAVGGLRSVEDTRYESGGPFPSEESAWEAGRMVEVSEVTILVTPTILPMAEEIREPELVP